MFLSLGQKVTMIKQVPSYYSVGIAKPKFKEIILSTESTFYASWPTDAFGLFSTQNKKAGSSG